MSPLLMVEGLRNLHDARYCAAVGISWTSFEIGSSERGRLSTAAVKEIMDWLSGLEAIGRFEHSSLAEITEMAASASISRVLLPIAFEIESATGLPMPILFDATEEAIDASLNARMETILTKIPTATFLVRLRGTSRQVANHILAPIADQLHCTVLHCDDPQMIFDCLESVTPMGFCLGSFAYQADGQLDYDSCDSFLEQYQNRMLR